jgi:Golgi phosphoprotein 3 (GPP34)
MPDIYLIRPAEVHGHHGRLDGGLHGTGRVADDLFMLAHDDRSGRARLAARPLGLGLAAGLLAELMLGGHPAVRVGRGDVVRVAREVPRAAISRHPLLRQIDLEPALRPVPDWLAFLACTAVRDVGARLEQAGYLIRVTRRFPGRAARLVPADATWAFAPVTRVSAALDPRRVPEPYTAALAGLAYACGLGFRMEPYLTARRTVEDTVSGLTPDLRALIRQTRNAVSSAVLSRH